MSLKILSFFWALIRSDILFLALTCFFTAILLPAGILHKECIPQSSRSRFCSNCHWDAQVQKLFSCFFNESFLKFFHDMAVIFFLCRISTISPECRLEISSTKQILYEGVRSYEIAMLASNVFIHRNGKIRKVQFHWHAVFQLVQRESHVTIFSRDHCKAQRLLRLRIRQRS